MSPGRSYDDAMVEPRIDDLLEYTETPTDPASRYALVIMAARRARQINSYHHQLGEGMGLESAPPPLVQSRSKNYLTMAMEEIAQGKLTFVYK
jgi:DNA-directed RNA polymerase subunit omega